MLEFFDDDSLGDIHFIRACTECELTDMVTHLMDVVLFALKRYFDYACMGCSSGQ